MTIVTSTTKSADLPTALPFDGHLTRTAAARRPNFLKEQYKYNSIPGVTRMAEGAPSFEYLPYTNLTFTAFQPEALPLSHPRAVSDSTLGPQPTLEISLPRKAEPTTFNLTTGLAYQDGQGLQTLPPFLKAYNQRLELVPAYSDWNVLVNAGATDGISKIADMLLERGDAVLVEEWTYPGSTASILPLGVELVGIKMDGEGLIPDHLEAVLAGWDERKRGAPRPRLLYTIPTGQNPTGATMTGERKKRIYEICVEYDVIILEDDPYYHLHMGPWAAPSGNDVHAGDESPTNGDNDSWVASLPPSFLKYDYQGRVIRVDTFSKTLCPGSRLGWYTASSFFVERLIRITEGTTSAPSGFSTLITNSLLDQWGVEGYIRWLRGIRAGYMMRRNWLCDAFDEVFTLKRWGVDAEPGKGGLEVTGSVFCHDKTRSGFPALSFIPPTAGMFVFMCIHFAKHPDYPALAAELGHTPATNNLQQRFWDILASKLILFCPAAPFDAGGEHTIGGQGNAFYRMSFAQPTYEEIRGAVRTLRECIQGFMA